MVLWLPKSVPPPHGIHLRCCMLVAGVGHGACGRGMVVLDVVPVRPAVVEVLVAAVGRLAVAPSVGALLERRGAHGGALLLHPLPCLRSPIVGGRLLLLGWLGESYLLGGCLGGCHRLLL